MSKLVPLEGCNHQQFSTSSDIAHLGHPAMSGDILIIMTREGVLSASSG